MLTLSHAKENPVWGWPVSGRFQTGLRVVWVSRAEPDGFCSCVGGSDGITNCVGFSDVIASCVGDFPTQRRFPSGAPTQRRFPSGRVGESHAKAISVRFVRAATDNVNGRLTQAFGIARKMRHFGENTGPKCRNLRAILKTTRKVRHLERGWSGVKAQTAWALVLPTRAAWGFAAAGAGPRQLATWAGGAGWAGCPALAPGGWQRGVTGCQAPAPAGG